MIGVTLVRGGVAKVNSVVEGGGPITIPLGLIPFVLGGRAARQAGPCHPRSGDPRRVTDVELRSTWPTPCWPRASPGAGWPPTSRATTTIAGSNIKRRGEARTAPSAASAGRLDDRPTGRSTAAAIFQPGRHRGPAAAADRHGRTSFRRSTSATIRPASAAGDRSPEVKVPNADSIEAASGPPDRGTTPCARRPIRRRSARARARLAPRGSRRSG